MYSAIYAGYVSLIFSYVVLRAEGHNLAPLIKNGLTSIKNLLYKDYAQQPPPLHFHYQCFDWNLDLSIQLADIVPGLQTGFRFTVPDSGKVELRYLHDYVGLTAGTRLKVNPSNIGIEPTVNFSGVIGTTVFSLGTDVAYDISSGTLSKYNAGLSINTDFLDASLTMNDKLDTLEASFHGALNPLTRTAIAAEMKHSFCENRTTKFTVGAQHALFPSTLLKARMDTDGKVGGVVQQGFLQKVFVAIAGEFDIRDHNATPKLGLSMALRP